MRRFLLVVLSPLLLAGVVFFIWTSSPTVALTLTRQQAIDRAAVDATVDGQITWTRMESKLVRYAEWRELISVPTYGEDTTNPDSLFWVVAYLGRFVPIESATYQCQWVMRVFAADGRAPETFGASMCGQGGWQWDFVLLPDHSWGRLDD
jgi:hypothetical protein